MNQKEIRELVEFLIEKDIAEFELERGDVKLKIRRGALASPVTVVPSYEPRPAGTPAAPQSAPVPAAKPAAAEEKAFHQVKSPIVGTFYEAPSPGAAAFVKVGDRVKQGQVVCIVEAMKLMNEIEADAAGEIVEVLVGNGQPVEYGQPLFAIRQ